MDPKAIAARTIARTCSNRRAAKRAGVDIDTIKSWLLDPEFQQMIVEDQTAATMRTVVAVQRAGPIAAKAIIAELQVQKPPRNRRGRPICKDEKFCPEKPNAKLNEVDHRKVRAAKIILDVFPKYVDIGHLAERVRYLEAQLASRGVYVTPVDDPPALTSGDEVIDAESTTEDNIT